MIDTESDPGSWARAIRHTPHLREIEMSAPPPTGPLHVMVDLETFGTSPGCDVRSIGAVVFNPFSGTFGDEFYINLRGGTNFGLTRDPDTVAWWEQQSCAARNALDIDQRFIGEGLRAFSAWFCELGNPSDIRLWAHGPHFDEAILGAAYRAIGERQPWHYRAPRDTRTIYDAAGGIDIPFSGTEHNALDDAKHQARCVVEAYRRLGLSEKSE